MPKILLFTHEHIVDIAGGAERIFVDMANEFCSKGYEVIAMYNSPKKGEPFYTFDSKVKFVNLHYENVEKNSQIPSCKCKIEDFICRNFWSETYEEYDNTAQKFENFINKEKPDLIICYFVFLFREISYCRNYKIPTIIMMHSDPDRYFKFFGTKYFELNKLALNKADCVTVLMPSFKKQAAKYYLGNIEVIGNPVDLIEKTESKISENKEIYKISCISRIDKFKRQDILVEAFASIANDYPNWELNLYGQAQPLELLDKINALIQKSGFDNQINYKGVISNAYEILKDTDIFVLPSDFEGFSLSTAEAMNAGVPCIAFNDCPGVNELIIHNQTGLLCEKTPESLADSINYLIENKDLRIKFGQNGKKEIQKYDSAIIWGKWLELTKKIIKKPIKRFNSKLILFLLLSKSLLFKK